MPLRIQDLPESDRPRERLLAQGCGALSDAELLALFINTGLKGENAIQVAQRMLQQYKSLHALSQRKAKEMIESVHGLGPAKAALIEAAFELGMRAYREKAMDIKLDRPEAIYEYLGRDMARLGQEVLRVIILNTRMKIEHDEELTRGTLNESIAHPRDIIRCAVVHRAHAFILAHNHPSGDPSPSEADRQLTRRIREISQLMKIDFADHVIIGAPRAGAKPYFSFREAGMM